MNGDDVDSAKPPSVWVSRDFPVLAASATACDLGSSPRVGDLAEATGLEVHAVRRSVVALERTDYVRLERRYGGVVGVRDVTGKAYSATGLHPDGEDALQTLVRMLQEAADRTPDAEEKTRLRRAANALGDIAGQVSAGLMTAFVSSVTGMN